GRAPATLVGEDFGVLLMPAAAGDARPELTGQLSGRGTPMTGRHQDGRPVPLEVSFGERADGGRHVVTAILRDVTERRTAEEALRTAEESRRQLEEQYRQSQKMEAIGQLAGGV